MPNSSRNQLETPKEGEKPVRTRLSVHSREPSLANSVLIPGAASNEDEKSDALSQSWSSRPRRLSRGSSNASAEDGTPIGVIGIRRPSLTTSQSNASHSSSRLEMIGENSVLPMAITPIHLALSRRGSRIRRSSMGNSFHESQPHSQIDFDVPKVSKPASITMPDLSASSPMLLENEAQTTMERLTEAQAFSPTLKPTVGTNLSTNSLSSVEKPTLILYPRRSMMLSGVGISNNGVGFITGLPTESGGLQSDNSLQNRGSLQSLSVDPNQLKQFQQNLQQAGFNPKRTSLRESYMGSRGSLLFKSMNRGQTMEPTLRETLGSQPSLTGTTSRSRPVSIISLKQLNKLKEASETREVQQEIEPVRDGPPAPEDAMQSVDQNAEYFDYVMYSQRHASMNFITQMDSNDIMYEAAAKAIKIKMIGTYVLGDKIGRGAFAKVKEGVCSETLQRVAVKIMSKKRLRKVPHGLENTMREIKLLRRLKHKNIVTLLDVFAKVEDDVGNTGVFPWFSTIEEEPIVWLFEDGTESEKDVSLLKWYLVFQFYPCSLQVLLDHSEGKRLSIDESHRYFVQLMEGMAYLHSQSVFHRDVKPGNLLITTDGVLKISDFGISEQFETSEGPMMSDFFAGTHLFISPEVIEGSAAFDAEKVDIWACGVTLYNIITGTFPFEFGEEPDIMALYDTISKGVFTYPPGVPTDLENLISGMLEKNTETRLNDTQVLNHVWSQTYFHSRVSPHILTYPAQDSPESSPDTPGMPATPSKPPATPIALTAEVSIASISLPLDLLKPGGMAGKPIPVIISQELAPTESTMIPYLESMYQKEIEEDLAKCGGVSDWKFSPSLENVTIFEVPEEDTPKRKMKFVGLFKGLFGSKSRSKK